MKDLFEKGLDLARNVTGLFEKVDGERRNCLRCRGNGLLNSRKLWNWNSRSAGNQPCWFCEGIGVMPLFGLKGFMLGRATAAINTEKLREPVGPPVQTHLYLYKYPCTRSKFGSYIPNQDLSSLLHKPSSVPVWVKDAAEELALQSIEDFKNGVEEVGNPSMPVMESKSIRRVPAQSLTTVPPKSSTNHELYVQSSRLTSKDDHTPLLKDSATFSNLEDVAQSTAGNHQDFTGGRYQIRVTRKADQALVGPLGLSFRQRIFERSRKLEPKQVNELHQKYLSMAPGAQSASRILTNSSTRRLRCARRRRNHIREKMERNTIVNSWCLQRMMYFKPEQATSEDLSRDASVNPSDALQAFSGNWKDLSQKCLAELTASSRPSTKSGLPQVGPRAPYPSLVNQPFYGKLVGKLQLLPSVAKPLKL